MARKRSDSAATPGPSEAAGQPAPDTNGVQAGGPGAAGKKPTQGTKPPLSKRDAVRKALKGGIDSPTRIAEYARREHGLEITTAHVSTIKGELKREKAGRAKGSPAGKQPQAPRAVAAQQKPEKATPATNSAGLTVE